MTQVDDAIRIVLQASSPLGLEELTLDQAGGYILPSDIVSDIDMPPFDKSAMDGYALRAADLKKTPAILDVVATIAAGTFPEITLGVGQAAQIMTGAPLPAGSDCVQMVEKSESSPGNQVKIFAPVRRGKHIAVRGEIMRQDDIVLRKGTYISPAVAGVLATVGISKVPIFKRPEVGILVTGDELVKVEQMPQAGQIRNSNGPAIFSQVLATGAIPVNLGIVSDDVTDLREKLGHGLRYDVLIISGGVSMGEFDLVEDILSDLGVVIKYEKVNIKPGKPTVFGTTDRCLVFGLPGNPVSANTIFEIIVKPSLRKIMGHKLLHNRRERAIIASDFNNTTERVNYHPSVTTLEDGKFFTAPVFSTGSADVNAYAASNSYLVVSGGKQSITNGDEVEVMLRDEFWQSC